MIAIHLKSSKHLPWIMVFSRLLLFAGWQAVIAVIYLLFGVPNSWDASAASVASHSNVGQRSLHILIGHFLSAGKPSLLGHLSFPTAGRSSQIYWSWSV